MSKGLVTKLKLLMLGDRLEVMKDTVSVTDIRSKSALAEIRIRVQKDSKTSELIVPDIALDSPY